MGAEQSTSGREGPPMILEARDLPSVAKYMKSQECKRVFVMLGAGISTSAGIPDFRSPETGLYANLARLNLPYPEAVFEINFFRDNPTPFYILARELLPGRFRPTPTHSFVRLLADRSLLRICFTQNIDTLERRAGVPASRIVEAHGSFASQRCIDCKTPYDHEKMRDCLKTGTIARCSECDGLVKPDIVFFGESLPQLFHQTVPQLRNADLLFVIGTSLTVQPFASLASIVPETCPRVLINLDHVGDFGSRSDDVICLGKCDEIVRDLCKELGWVEGLDAAWKETENSVVDFEDLPPEGAIAQEKAEEEVEEIRQKLENVLGPRRQKATEGEETAPEAQPALTIGGEAGVIEVQSVSEPKEEAEVTHQDQDSESVKAAKEKL